MAALIRNLYDEVYRARQGNVSITPIVTPNELLVVGRQENVKTVRDAGGKAWTSRSAPDAQFQVFPLQWIEAATAATAIQGSFRQPRRAVAGGRRDA